MVFYFSHPARCCPTHMLLDFLINFFERLFRLEKALKYKATNYSLTVMVGQDVPRRLFFLTVGANQKYLVIRLLRLDQFGQYVHR